MIVSLLRKPGVSNLVWGCGGMAIDRCRIPTRDVYFYPRGPGGKSMQYSSDKRGSEVSNPTSSHVGGRYPANLILGHLAGCFLEGFRDVNWVCAGGCGVGVLDSASRFYKQVRMG